MQPRAAQHRSGGRLLHSRRGTQPTGAPRRARSGRLQAGPARRQVHRCAQQVRLWPCAEVTPSPPPPGYGGWVFMAEQQPSPTGLLQCVWEASPALEVAGPGSKPGHLFHQDHS